MLSGLINTAEKTMVAVGHIKADGGTQMRAGLDEATVNEYADAMAETGWGDFPPVVLYHDGTDYWLADGFHRLAAFRSLAAGVDALIPADVRSGTRRDAILHAAGANANHGLRRTNADKRRAVEVLLRDEEWRQWSDAEIARRCNVTPMTVGRVRKELIYNNVIDAPSQRTVQRDGVTYTQNTAKIGKKPIRYESGLPALQMPAPGAGAAPMAAKIPIEDWELEDIVEQVAQEYYGSVTARAGAEMTQQSRAHAGEYWAKLQRVLAPFDVSVERVEAAVAAAVERLVGERRALRPGSPEAKALAREIKAATWADRRGPVVEKGRGGERKTTQTASALTVDGDLTAADVQVLQPMPPTEPEMVPLAAVSRLGQVIGTALGAAATSPTVEAGIARARELLVTPTPPADDRRTRLSQYAAQFEATLAALRDWAQLTGRFTLTSEAERGLHRVLEATRSELAALNGQPHQVWGEETTI